MVYDQGVFRINMQEKTGEQTTPKQEFREQPITIPLFIGRGTGLGTTRTPAGELAAVRVTPDEMRVKRFSSSAAVTWRTVERILGFFRIRIPADTELGSADQGVLSLGLLFQQEPKMFLAKSRYNYEVNEGVDFSELNFDFGNNNPPEAQVRVEKTKKGELGDGILNRLIIEQRT